MLYKLLVLLILTSLTCSCASTDNTKNPKQSNLSLKQSMTDAHWSPEDLETVAKAVIPSLVNSRSITPEYKKSLLLLGEIRNDCDEKIKTDMILQHLQVALIKEGFQFVTEETLKIAFENHSIQNSDLYETGKLKKIGKLLGAKMVLRGLINNMRKMSANQNAVFYYIVLQIVDIETGRIIWTDEVEISRTIERQKLK